MLDFIGASVLVIAIAVNLTAVASILPLSLAQQLTLAAMVGAWVGVAAALAAAGEQADARAGHFP